MSVTNVEAFNAAVGAFAAKHITGESMQVFQQKIALDALGKLSSFTPIDTGYLNLNWQLTIGTPAVGTKGKPKTKYSQSSTPDPAEVLKVAAIPPFSLTWITNNAEYAEYVNNGTAKMAAKQMVERTIIDLTTELEKNL